MSNFTLFTVRNFQIKITSSSQSEFKCEFNTLFFFLSYTANVLSLLQLHDIFKDKTIDPNIRDDAGYTALHWFVQKPRRDHHKLLLLCLQSGCGFDIDGRDYLDNTPLHIAAEVSF